MGASSLASEAPVRATSSSVKGWPAHARPMHIQSRADQKNENIASNRKATQLAMTKRQFGLCLQEYHKHLYGEGGKYSNESSQFACVIASYVCLFRNGSHNESCHQSWELHIVGSSVISSAPFLMLLVAWAIFECFPWNCVYIGKALLFGDMNDDTLTSWVSATKFIHPDDLHGCVRVRCAVQVLA